MKTHQPLKAALVGLMFGVFLFGVALGDGRNERAGVQTRDGDASPPAGSIHPGGISNVDDYTQQDEQVNIQGDKDSVVKVLRVNQKNLINDYVVRTFPIRNAAPCELRQAFQEIVGAEGGRAEIIINSQTKESYLWVAAPKFQIPYIEAALKALDVPWLKDDLDGSSQQLYRAKFRTIDRVAALARLPGAAAVGVANDNLITIDAIANVALVSGEPFRVNAFLKRAPEVDRPVPQILLEATVYEVEVSNEERLGLDYIAWKNGPGRSLFDFILWGSSHSQRSRNMTSIFDPFVAPRTAATGTTDGNSGGWYMGANYLLTAAYLDFLQGTGRARIVTSGRILARNGDVGQLSATDQVIYIQATPNEANTPVNGITPGAAVPAGGALPIWNRELDQDQSINIGLTLSVRPFIAEETTELYVRLDLNNFVEGTVSSGTPQVRNYSAISTILVRNEQPFCVGGLRRTEDVKRTQKIPVLGSIPVLGWLFGHEATVKRETEIVVVLVPKIKLESEADLELATEADRQIRARVEKRVKLELPRTEFGFDQWLIGK